MTWSSSKEEYRLCEKWLIDPLTNPETGRKIERNNKKYKEWAERCKKIGLYSKPVTGNIKMTRDMCRQFSKNPSVNPKTGKKIAIGGPTYKKLLKECKNCINNPEPKVKLEGEYPPPDKDGNVLIKREDNRNYIIRQTKERKVYSPLNKYASGTPTKIFYKETWDYKNGYYRPVFIGKKPDFADSGVCSSHQFSPNMKIDFKKEKLSNRKQENPKYLVDTILNTFVTLEKTE